MVTTSAMATLLAAAILAPAAPPPVGEWTFADGTSVRVETDDRNEQRLVTTAAFLADSASEFTEWVNTLEPVFLGGQPGTSPLGGCVSQAQSICGQGKVCWVQFSANGSTQGSCSFGCAITGATPPCPPPPAQAPPPSGNH